MVTINKMIAETVRQELQDAENKAAAKFIKEHAAHMAMYDKETMIFVNFVADRCFRVGFKQGNVAMIDLMEKHRQGKEAK